MTFYLLILVLFAAENEEIEDDEPGELLQELFLGELASVQEKGEIQFTTGIAYESEEKTWTAPLVLEYGISDRFQIAAELEAINKKDDERRHTELDSWGLELAYGLIQGERNLLTLGLEGSQESEEDEETELEFFMATSWSTSYGLFNLDSRFGEDEEQYTLAGIFPFSDWIFSSELSYQSEEDEEKLMFAPGITRSLGSWEFALGTPLNLKDTDHWEVALNLTIEFD